MMVVRWLVMSAVVAAGCGRIAFHPIDDDGGTVDDARSDARADAPPLVVGGCNFVELGLGARHSCARDQDGDLYCWGDNLLGQLGDGTDVPHPVPQLALDRFAQIGRSDHNTMCGVRDDTTVWCWGENRQNIIVPAQPVTTPQQVQLAGAPFDHVVEVQVGEHHACARRDDDTVWCWGWNDRGQVGVVAGADVPEPLEMTGVVSDELAVGYAQNCVRRGDTVSCWGWNEWGQLGDGTTTTRETDAPVLENAQPIASITALAVGYLQSCAARSDGGARCWGTGRQVGNPDNGAATTDGAVPVFSVTPNAPLTGVIAVGTGDGHSCALRNDTTVWCWGDNGFGELGDGSMISRVLAAPVTESLGGPPISGVLAVSVGNSHNCALRATDILCWGRNATGELGNGTTTPMETVPVTVICP